jgi:hypothetical protein
MTINDEFFKKTQENLRRIKAQNNQKTLNSYNIDGKAEEVEELLSTQPSQPQETTNNVVSLADFRKNKEKDLVIKSNLSTEERHKRIAESIKRVHDLMDQLQKNNTRTSSND